MEEPSIGRIVHYVAYGTPGGEYPEGAHRAAIITEVGANGFVGLCIMNPTGLFFTREVPFGRQNTPGSWHWPERV
jgi:hypothetical protein